MCGRCILFLIVVVVCCAHASQDMDMEEAMKNKDGMSFFEGVKAGHLPTVKKFLQGSDPIDINAQGPGGQTALMGASLQGHLKLVKFLMEEGADWTIGEMMGYTPLHGCAFQGRANVCKYLLEQGLPHEAHKDGYYPIHRAAWGKTSKHADTLRVFIEFGIDVNLPTTPPDQGAPATMWDIAKDNKLIAEVLKEFNAKSIKDTANKEEL